MSSPAPDPPTGLTPPASTDPSHVGTYRVVGRIGAGGMGTVYAAVDAANNPLALKVVHQEYAVDPEFRSRFGREVNLLGRVTGRCVPRFLGADTEGQRPWLATEYVRGLTLRQHIARHGPLEGAMLYGLAMGAAEALQAIHAAGIVHRDLKPGNVILAPDGPKVLDFGIARAVEESAITRTGLLGTPGWIAPELFNGAEPGPAADIFAWGGLLAYAATGNEPFGTGPPDVLTLRTVEEEPDLSGLPSELYPLVSAALAKDPSARPTTAQALTESTRLLSGHTPASTEEATEVVPGLLDQRWSGAAPESPDTSNWAELAPPKRRRWPRRVLTAGAAVLAVAVVGTGGVLAWQELAPAGDSAAHQDNPMEGNGGSADSTTADRGTGVDGNVDLDALEHGGTGLLGDGEESTLDISTINGELVTDDTLHIGTLAAGGEAGDLAVGDVEPRLSITFHSAQAEDDGIRFTGEAEYLTPVGSYVLHSNDFFAYNFRHAAPDDREEWHSSDDTVLAILNEDNTTDDFSFFIPDAPNGEYNYLEYQFPEMMWGHEPDSDSLYGENRWCYQEGDTWFENETNVHLEGMPCD
ncbi:serine/threonine-protein kinase [Lipingzhangella sp. LS1_29]|uniref:Serine/threonine-protein kinase n=1 Tax=Lipingzhangella rawalii TaxID=2055835 RepID=A0ABU2H8L0_9ACTN|nr:serine/threonine-protein kinase [Lipingzhangella rawalii]MDS1270934.1 serine/threonine-protein kinase [Lipingzhangella rawalii]